MQCIRDIESIYKAVTCFLCEEISLGTPSKYLIKRDSAPSISSRFPCEAIGITMTTIWDALLENF
jgi:hypothetical protein